MFFVRSCAFFAVSFFLASLLVSSLAGQETQPEAANPENYRSFLIKSDTWYAGHYHDAAQAKRIHDLLKSIGCETEMLDHAGHIDVQYRCAAWKKVTVKTDKDLAEWQKWLPGMNLQSIVLDPPEGLGLTNVRLQLASPLTLHIHNAAEADETGNLLTLLGCKVTRSAHDGHIDLTVECPEWKTIGFASHDAAHKWQDVFNKMGFATEHAP
jgi:hypothetical protein